MINWIKKQFDKDLKLAKTREEKILLFYEYAKQGGVLDNHFQGQNLTNHKNIQTIVNDLNETLGYITRECGLEQT